MTIEEAKSCIGTIEMLQRLAYNIHGVMDVVDVDNCKNIIKALEQEPCEDVVKKDCDKCAYYDNGANNEACDECFADEYEHPNFKPKAQPCNDCISRQAVLDAINTYDKFGYTETGCFVREPEGDYVPYIHYDDVIKCIKNAPSVTPKEKIGEWFDDAGKIDAKYGKHSYKCPKCGKYASYFVSGTEVWWDRIEPNFCPNCGAKMQEVEE